MQSQPLRADPRVGADDSARAGLIERKLSRFRPEVQLAVRNLARRHSRLADLAASFPALLVALAVPHAGFNREPVVARAIAGVPLAELARAAGIPLWLRKLGPEFFDRPVPRLPDNSNFCRRIMNHVPRSLKFAPRWFKAVAFAAYWGDEELGVWVARNLVQSGAGVHSQQLRAISLWAWFSSRPDTRAGCLIERKWTPFMQGHTAVGAAYRWVEMVSLYANLGSEPIADVWMQPGTVDGYDFVPLRSTLEVGEEARIMQNCLRTYGDYLAHNTSRLWSVRRSGQRIATLEVCRLRGDPLLNVGELKGPRNNSPSLEVSLAARRWLHMHDPEQLKAKELEWNTVPLRSNEWIELWKPYWLAKRSIPKWLPLGPSRDALNGL